MIEWLNQGVTCGFIITQWILLWASSTGCSSYRVLAGLLYNSIHHQSTSQHKRRQAERPIMRRWEWELSGSVIDWWCLCNGRSYVYTVIFGKNNSNQIHSAESCGRGRVMDDERNALGWQTPHPLICKTALSVSVCMATSAPHYSFSCRPLSVCWWRTLPLKDLEGAFTPPPETPSGSLRCQFWVVKPLNCCTHRISNESIPDEVSQSLSGNAKTSYTTIKHLSWVCCDVPKPRHWWG